jgi:hypothetical protein
MSDVRQLLVESTSKDRDAATRAQLRIKAVLAKLNQFDTTITRGLEQIGRISAEVSENVATAIRALQFEDMVGQLIDCMQKRLERLEDVMSRLGQLGRSGQVTPEALGTELEAQGLQIRAEYAAALTSPVMQEDMGAGSVELF